MAEQEHNASKSIKVMKDGQQKTTTLRKVEAE